jgi:spore germination cell wall hydrolase CwlJ-like protein
MMSVALACLSLAVYFEARSEPVAGQVAVAQVVLNRVESPRFPDTVCEVVYQYRQFSFYWDGKSDRPKEAGAWENAQLIASAVMAGSQHATLAGVLHYHADYVQPRWAEQMAHVATYGEHHFYE